MSEMSGWTRFALGEVFSVGSFFAFMILSLLVTTPFTLHAWNRHDVPMFILLGVFSAVTIVGWVHGAVFAFKGLQAYWRPDQVVKIRNRQQIRLWHVRYAVVFAVLFAVQLLWLMIADLPLGWSTASRARWEQIYHQR